MPPIEVAAAALLVLLAGIRFKARSSEAAGVPRTRPLWLPAAFALGLVAAVAIHHVSAPHLGQVIDAESSRLVEHARPRLREALEDPGTELVLVVNGASVTARGVDGRALEARLRRETGLSIAVVQLSLAGANHFERQAMARALVDGLPGALRTRLASMPMVILWEVHRGYDTELLATLEENRGTARAFAYLDPPGALEWLRTALSSTRPAVREQALDMAPVVAWHVGMSIFRVGSSRWFTSSDELEPLAGFNPEDRLREQERVVGLASIVERMDAVRSRGGPRYVDTHLLPAYLRPFGNDGAEVVFFSPPSRHVGHLAYVHQFCKDHRQRVCIGFRNRALLDSLDHRRYWVDGSHLSPAGADIYTQWFADVLARAIVRHDLARREGDDSYG